MRLKVLSVAVWAAFSGPTLSQSLADVGGPREVPPASFKGQQYVDSRGCVFLKAGYGGQTTWVPRVTAARKALCGFPPTFGKVEIEMAGETPTPAPQRRTAAVDPVVNTPAPVARVRATPAVRVTAAAADTASTTDEVVLGGTGAAKIGCFTSAPMPMLVRLRGGETAIVCTRGDGSLKGWRLPIYPEGSPMGAPLTDLVARLAMDPAWVIADRTAPAADLTSDAVPRPPKGYKLAWKDDRLNPQRGKGTQEGWAAQDRVWTRDLPSRLTSDPPKWKRQATRQPVMVSTKSAPDLPTTGETAITRGTLVQVGTFGLTSNADAAAARLAALGFPVSKGHTTMGGKTLQIVFAGPFLSGAEAGAALTAARRAGFSDAFLR